MRIPAESEWIAVSRILLKYIQKYMAHAASNDIIRPTLQAFFVCATKYSSDPRRRPSQKKMLQKLLLVFDNCVLL
jgi:hypothetical protein